MFRMKWGDFMAFIPIILFLLLILVLILLFVDDFLYYGDNLDILLPLAFLLAYINPLIIYVFYK